MKPFALAAMVAAVSILPGTGVVGADAISPSAAEASPAAVEIDRLLSFDTGVRQEQLSERCDDTTFLRRVFLDLVGHPPTQDDILAFGLDSSPQKRTAAVDRLLADPDFGNHWGKYWRDVIMYRRSDDRSLIAAPYLADFVSSQWNAGRPWSETASRIITAAGDIREHGEAGLIVAQSAMPEDVTAEVSRIFLGIQIQCAQCHDHPSDSWKREQFHHLAAFFPRIGVRLNLEERTMVVTTIDNEPRFRRPNNNNRFFGTLEHHMPDKDDPASQGTEMVPVLFLNQRSVPIGTRDQDRRGALARWLTDPQNPWFAKAFVNRLWGELVGQGFVEPVDDLGPDRECSAPQTLDYLASQFAAHHYDVRWFFRTVLATQAYQRTSRSRALIRETPFAATCAQRLRADQLFDSLVTALNLQGRLPEGRAAGPPNLRRDPRSQFIQTFGYDPSEPRDEIASSIPQALMLMNSPVVHQAISSQRRDALGGILRRESSNDGALAELYLTVLGRLPTSGESKTCLDFLRTAPSRDEGFEDILWSLINSTEFTVRR